MSDDETVSVLSTAHTAVRIREPMPEEFRDRPGDAPLLRSAVLNSGTFIGDPSQPPGLTHGVSAEVFKLWHEAQVKAKSALAGLFRIVSSDDIEKMPSVESGMQPGLDRMKDEGTDDAGSTVTHEGPLTSDEMKPTSDTPNDDTPRGDPDLVPVSHSQEPANAKFQPGVEDTQAVEPLSAPAAEPVGASPAVEPPPKASPGP